jgi:hypothetical protein
MDRFFRPTLRAATIGNKELTLPIKLFLAGMPIVEPTVFIPFLTTLAALLVMTLTISGTLIWSVFLIGFRFSCGFSLPFSLALTAAVSVISKLFLIDGGLLATKRAGLDEYVEYIEFTSETLESGLVAKVATLLLALVSITSSDVSSSSSDW